jgi:hypothetical protein
LRSYVLEIRFRLLLLRAADRIHSAEPKDVSKTSRESFESNLKTKYTVSIHLDNFLITTIALTYPKRGILQLIAQKQSASKEREVYVI